MKKFRDYCERNLYGFFSKQTIRVMKLTMFLSFLTFFQLLATESYAQLTKITLKLENVKISDALKEIEDQSEFFFLYSPKLVDVERKVNIDAEKESIKDILSNIFDEKVKFIVYNSQIILTPSDVTSLSTALQQQQITGTVTDKSGAPLVGVNVVVTGTTQGAITDIAGKYSINIPQGAKSLTFSFVGMVQQEINIGTLSKINVTMAELAVSLEEVMVIGYGTQKKVTSTGSIVSSRGDEIKKSPATNLTNDLSGRLPGLVAVSSSGNPGDDGAQLYIRGTNTIGDSRPLIVVDGIANRDMERLNPSDVENITILKDASAAIYGSAAANGVILVTTKRGSIGKPKITIDMNNGFTQPTRVPEMASSAQYATMLNEIIYYQTPALGRYGQFSKEDIQQFSDGSDPWGHPNTNWYAEVFKPWSYQSQENVSISGGTDNIKYFISGGARYEDGVYQKSATNYKQYNFRANIDSKINKYINVGFDVSGRQEGRSYPINHKGDPIAVITTMKPTMVAWWPDGSPGPDVEEGNNPAVTATDLPGYDKSKSYIFESTLRTNITIPWVNGLTITTNTSFDKDILFHKKFEKPWYLNTWNGNPEHITVPSKRGFDAPQLSEDMSDGQSINLNAYATYEKTFLGKHNIKAMVGTERRSGITNVFSAFRKNFISSEIDQLFAGASDEYMSNNGSASLNAYLSYFGRFNYDLGRKYMAEFVWRSDGSYKFPPSKRFGFFPGISVGWRISEENFWKNNLSFFNDFKIRGSWGQTGNDRINDYQYLTTYGFPASDNDACYVFQTEDSKVLNEIKIPNSNITWEVANQANMGFDAFFFNNKLSVSADYFDNMRSQILIKRNASVPTSTGLTLPPENIGKVKNRGLEAVITYKSQVGDLKYNLSINGSYSKNKIVFWDETTGIPDYQQSTGRPIGSSLYYEAIGIFKDQAAVDAYPHWAGAQPGDIIFKDVNGDGKIDGQDRVMNEKNNIPRFVSALSINLEYKQFDLSVLVQGATGAQNYWLNGGGEFQNYYKEFADNRWTPENTGSSYPRTFNRAEEYWTQNANTFWLRKTDYVRLKNVEVGYSFHGGVLRGIESLRFYVNGLNLLTFDEMKIYDPESLGSYPLQRIINVGLTLTF